MGWVWGSGVKDEVEDQANEDARVLTVVVADDHPPTRAGIRAALEGSGFIVCSETANSDDAVDAARAERPDVCILDIHMPGNGISAAERITTEMPEIAVVMLTVSRDDTDLFDALRAGAAGYLLKDTDPDRLPHALRGVLAGEAALPRTLVARLMEEFRTRNGRRRLPLLGGRPVELTGREMDVLGLLRDGLSTEQIAERLFVTPVTVRTHVSSLLRKLKVPDRESAVRLFDDS
jgi:DNA-binding NarL/FixJ family response regulator